MPEFPEDPLQFFPDFDLSLRRYGLSNPHYRIVMNRTHYNDFPPAIRIKIPYYRRFKQDLENNYNIIRKFKINKAPPLRIPKKIHQIWLGKTPLPEKYEQAMTSWSNWEGWEHKLWTDEDVHKISLQNAELYHALTNLGERSDLLRYEILFQQGGIYIDMDCICINPQFFEMAHFNYDFYAGVEPLETANCRISCCNALIGSAPEHPIVKALISNLPNNIANFPNKKMTWSRTGPIYFSETISQNLFTEGKINMIFPPTVFYPLSYHELGWPKEKIFALIRHETASIHLWEGSWKKTRVAER